MTRAAITRRYARFSRDRRHRYVLGRAWDVAQGDLLSGWEPPAGAGSVVFVMLNPSVASDKRDDPTLCRCIGFAQAWGFRRLEVVNLFSLVTPGPRVLRAAADPVGPKNDAWLKRTVRSADRVVCAWGCHGDFLDRARTVRTLLSRQGCRLMHLGLTREGHPKHPLYLPAATEPDPWI
jgi:hypothetical protein